MNVLVICSRKPGVVKGWTAGLVRHDGYRFWAASREIWQPGNSSTVIEGHRVGYDVSYCCLVRPAKGKGECSRSNECKGVVDGERRWSWFLAFVVRR
jgi:hypothetical protein